MLCPLADSSVAGFFSWRMPRTPLGRVRDGVLRPLVPVASVDGRGMVRVPCPKCGRVRVWCSADPTIRGLVEGE